MKRRALSIFVLTGLLVLSPAVGQMMIRSEGGDVVFLRELGVVVGTEEGSDEIRLIVVMPQSREVALEKGDLVLMVDGVRIRDVGALREAYEAAEVGQVVKLGIRRGDQRFLTSFEKQEPEDLERGGTRMMMIGGPGADFDDLQPLPEFGVILGEKEGGLVVAMELPMGESAFQTDDVIRSINGREVSTLARFREIYEPVAVGDDVDLGGLRGDEEVGATRAKADPARMRVRVGH